MTNRKDQSRREFLGRLGAGTVLGAAAAARGQSSRSQPGGAIKKAIWAPSLVLKHPNILIIMVDQLRLPAWLDSGQMAMLSDTVLPNIVGRLQANSYSFEQFFVNATACTPSRACLLTGLYTPQTAMYSNGASIDTSSSGLNLNTAYPTWGLAAQALNPAYAGNFWWFGKWHLSQCTFPSPLAAYGFNTSTYPGGPGPEYNGSPNGVPNEGTNGGSFPGATTLFANDAQIAADFIEWLDAPPTAPWCATVSLVNPHDITSAPAWLQNSPFPPTGVAPQPVYFNPPPGQSPPFYTGLPSPWNYEDLTQVTNKPAWQYSFLSSQNSEVGTVTDWVLFLNQYFWLQNFVDVQVGLILDALASSPCAKNTVVIFLSDHGEFAGSHGLHGKGSAVYDEALRVPFYVQFPGQSGSVSMNQMCCAVDFFGLICDLVTGGSGRWRKAYPSLRNRQSLWSFLYRNSSETRVAPAPVGLPYVLHTFDDAHGIPNASNYHIVSMRSKHDPSRGVIGAKLAFYSNWKSCANFPDGTPPDCEFYDYNPATANNTSELGNDYSSNNPVTQQTIANYTQVMGVLAPPATGLMATELNAPLTGVGTNGQQLRQVRANALQAYFDFVEGPGACKVPTT